MSTLKAFVTDKRLKESTHIYTNSLIFNFSLKSIISYINTCIEFLAKNV